MVITWSRWSLPRDLVTSRMSYSVYRTASVCLPCSAILLSLHQGSRPRKENTNVIVLSRHCGIQQAILIYIHCSTVHGVHMVQAVTMTHYALCKKEKETNQTTCHKAQCVIGHNKMWDNIILFIMFITHVTSGLTCLRQTQIAIWLSLNMLTHVAG